MGTRTPHFKIHRAKTAKGKPKQFYFTLAAANGKVLVTSETYPSRRNARHGIAAVQRAVCDGGSIRDA